jgi:hypothetical protein
MLTGVIAGVVTAPEVVTEVVTGAIAGIITDVQVITGANIGIVILIGKHIGVLIGKHIIHILTEVITGGTNANPEQDEKTDDDEDAVEKAENIVCEDGEKY